MGFYSTEGVTLAVQAGTRYMLRWEKGHALRGVRFMHCDCVILFFFFEGVFNGSAGLWAFIVHYARACTLRFRHRHDQIVCILS
jgi:hypothetical protein